MFTLLKRYPISIWPLMCVVLIVLAQALDLSHILRFEADAINYGEWWRMVTAHWVHLGWAHCLLNSAGFLLLAWLQPKAHWGWWITFYIISSFVISLHLYFNLQIYSYVGASGVLHGLLILAAYFSRWLEPWRQYLMVSIISLKLIWEQTAWYSDRSVSELIGGYVVVDAHLIGGICGLVIIVLTFTKNLKKSS